MPDSRKMMACQTTLFGSESENTMAKDMSKINEGLRKFRCDVNSSMKLDLLGGLDVSEGHRANIRVRLEMMPEKCRGTYVRAMSGKSKAAGIKSFCRMCLGWQSKRQVTDCTDPACPLYPYRPFRPKD